MAGHDPNGCEWHVGCAFIARDLFLNPQGQAQFGMKTASSTDAAFIQEIAMLSTSLQGGN